MTKYIAIIGSALSGNKGAAAMLESSIQTLSGRIPGVKFILFSMYPKEDRRLNTYKNLEIIDAKPLQLGIVINVLALAYKIFPFWRQAIVKRSKAIRALKKADVLLDQGGITFVDGREKFLIYNIASILPAMNVGTPVFKCAQALGPFKSPLNYIAARMFLPKMNRIIARGSITHRFLQDLKLNNIEVGADYAFSLDLQKSDKEEATMLLPKTHFSGKRIVGVSPSVVLQKKAEKAGKDYQKIMANFIDWLTATGYGVVLVPHSARNTDKTHNNDLPLCRSIYGSLKSKEEVEFIDQELSSQTLRAIIGRCDFFVASRFHAMVSSLAMKVPTIVVGWSHKYKEVLEMFGLEQWAFGQDKLTNAYLKAMFKKAVAQEADIKAQLKTNLPKVKRLSMKQADMIAELVKGR